MRWWCGGRTSGTSASPRSSSFWCTASSLVRSSFASFDPDTARVSGVPVRGVELVLHLSLAVAVAVATRALGALPVFSFLVLPAGAALLFSERRASPGAVPAMDTVLRPVSSAAWPRSSPLPGLRPKRPGASPRRPHPAAPAPPAQAPSCRVAPEPVGPHQPRRPIPWAELLRRTFQTDVLTCPRCGGTRRVVAVALRSATAQAILEHLRLSSRALPLAPATSPLLFTVKPQDTDIAAVDFYAPGAWKPVIWIFHRPRSRAVAAPGHQRVTGEMSP